MTSIAIHYEAIADSMASQVPAGWQKAWVSSEVGEDISESTYDYTDAAGTEHWFDPDARSAAEIGRNLREIRRMMTPDGSEPWTRCKFVLFPDRQFKFDVEYAD